MLRAQKGIKQRVYLSAYNAAGTAGTGATPTVSVSSLRSGSEIVTDAATVASGGLYYYDLLPANSTSQLDVLTVTWEYTLDSVAQSQVDTVAVVDSRLASLEAVDNQLGRGGTAANYTHRQKDLAVQAAEEMLEGECLRAFTGQYATCTLDGNGGSRYIHLPHYPVLSLVGVTIDGTAKTVSDFTLYPDTGRVYSELSAFTSTNPQNVVVKYTHGETSVPMDVSRAVTLIACSLLADGPWDDRGFGVTTDGGFVRLLTAGVGGTAFSIPEVQATVNRWRRPLTERILAGQTR